MQFVSHSNVVCESLTHKLQGAHKQIIHTHEHSTPYNSALLHIAVHMNVTNISHVCMYVPV